MTQLSSIPSLLWLDTWLGLTLPPSSGLFGLSHSQGDEDLQIEAFPPGHIEVYDLDSQGRASLAQRVRFSRTGEVPKFQLAISDSELHCEFCSKQSNIWFIGTYFSHAPTNGFVTDIYFLWNPFFHLCFQGKNNDTWKILSNQN